MAVGKSGNHYNGCNDTKLAKILYHNPCNFSTDLLQGIFAPFFKKRSVIMPITKVTGKKNGKQKYRVRVNYTDSFGKAQQIERTAYGLDEAKEIERELRLKATERVSGEGLTVDHSQ